MNIANWYRAGRGIGHHGQAVIRADGQGVRQRDGLQAGIFLLGIARRGAVGEENVGPAFGDMPAIRAASGGRRGARGAAGELQRLALESRPDVRPDRFGLAKGLEGIVAGRIGLRGRGAEFDLRVEHAIEQRIARHGEPGRTSAHNLLRANSTTGPLRLRSPAPAGVPCSPTRTPLLWRRRQSRPSAAPTRRIWPAPLR